MTREEMEKKVEPALDVFWAKIAEQFPDAEGGDMSPAVLHDFEEAAVDAVTHWYEINVPGGYWARVKEGKRS